MSYFGEREDYDINYTANKEWLKEQRKTPQVKGVHMHDNSPISGKEYWVEYIDGSTKEISRSTYEDLLG